MIASHLSHTYPASLMPYIATAMAKGALNADSTLFLHVTHSTVCLLVRSAMGLPDDTPGMGAMAPWSPRPPLAVRGSGDLPGTASALQPCLPAQLLRGPVELLRIPSVNLQGQFNSVSPDVLLQWRCIRPARRAGREP